MTVRADLRLGGIVFWRHQTWRLMSVAYPLHGPGSARLGPPARVGGTGKPLDHRFVPIVCASTELRTPTQLANTLGGTTCPA